MRKLVLLAAVVTTLLLIAAACAEATPTPTPRPTPTTIPTATPTATPRPGVPTATPTPVPTATPTPRPTATPTPIPAGQLSPTGTKVKFHWSMSSVPTLLQMKLVKKPWADQVPTLSNGRVTIDYSTWSELGLSGFDSFRVTRLGVVEGVWAPLLYVAGDLAMAEAGDLAGLLPTIDMAEKAAVAWLPEVNKALEAKKFGVTGIVINPYPAQELFCKPEIKGMADLKGKKVRVFGTSLGDLVEGMGGQSVTISFPEVYSALERGVIDCAITGTASGNAEKWYEVTNYMYTLSTGWSTEVLWANTEWWNGLPADIKAFLEFQLAKMQKDLWKLGDELTLDGIYCNTGKADKCKIATLDTKAPMIEVTPSAADLVRLKEILTTIVLPRWAKRAGPEAVDIFNRVLAPIVGVQSPKP